MNETPHTHHHAFEHVVFVSPGAPRPLTRRSALERVAFLDQPELERVEFLLQLREEPLGSFPTLRARLGF